MLHHTLLLLCVCTRLCASVRACLCASSRRVCCTSATEQVFDVFYIFFTQLHKTHAPLLFEQVFALLGGHCVVLVRQNRRSDSTPLRDEGRTNVCPVATSKKPEPLCHTQTRRATNASAPASDSQDCRIVCVCLFYLFYCVRYCYVYVLLILLCV